MELSYQVVQNILDVAVAIMNADFASLQAYDAERKGLRMITHHGLDAVEVKSWDWVFPCSVTPCGKSLRTGSRVIVPDIDACAFLASSRGTYRKHGIRAVQTTPLRATNGNLLGMVSTHWRSVHNPTNHELHLFDKWAQQTADVFTTNLAVAELLHQADVQVQRSQKMVVWIEREFNRIIAEARHTTH